MATGNLRHCFGASVSRPHTPNGAALLLPNCGKEALSPPLCLLTQLMNQKSCLRSEPPLQHSLRKKEKQNRDSPAERMETEAGREERERSEGGWMGEA